MYTGASASSSYFGEGSEFKLRSIPYFFQKVAAYYGKDKDMIAVFEKVGKMPALSKSTGYKSGRNRNPLVEWEITALKELLTRIGFPILEVEGQEADYVINNYCRMYGDSQDIYILSADQDLAANVRDGEFTTQMLSYSTVSYNINKSNFKAITGVDYNFMNLHKILLGCKSDKIKPFPQGREIYQAYFSTLESKWRRQFGYQKGTHTSADFEDSYLLPLAEFEQFVEWYRLSKYYDDEGLRELNNRRQLVEGPVFDLPRVFPVNWQAYNDLIASLNMNSACSIKAIRSGMYNKETVDEVIYILRKAQSANLTMFEGQAGELDGLEEVGDIQNILGLLDTGGAL